MPRPCSPYGSRLTSDPRLTARLLPADVIPVVAGRIDREADFALQAGLHRLAERLAKQAAALREINQ